MKYNGERSELSGQFIGTEFLYTLYISKLFDILARRSLPPPLLAFLQNCYKDQAIQVRWNDVLSQPFGVSNGVRQGGVLSPILFTVYIDELINMLLQQDIGCHYGPYFCGVQ